MGYLSIDSSTLPDFKKAVISFWVRIPQATLTKVAAAAADDNGPFSGYVPFVTFGEAQTETGSTQTFTPLVTIEEVFPFGDDSGVSISFGDNVYSSSGSFQVPPTFVGANVSNDGSSCTLVLSVQLASRGDCTGLKWTSESISADGTLHMYLYSAAISKPIQVQNLLADPGTIPCNIDWQGGDVTDILLGGQNDSFIANGTIELPPDMWHHVLIAFDISGSCDAVGTQGTVEQLYYPQEVLPDSSLSPDNIPEGVTQNNFSPDKGTLSTSCKLWAAVDDVNYTAGDLTGNFNTDLGLGPNDWATNLGVRTAGTTSPGNGSGIQAGTIAPAPSIGFSLCTFNVTYSGNGTPSYSYAASGVPINGKPFGIPASAAFVDNIFKVEMAEFQMFTGVSMDTGVEANRRAFIAPNKDGKLVPVNPFALRPPADPTEGLDPHTLIAPGKPHKLLGKPADIVLTSASRNWIGGINTGTSKDKFKAAGTIKAFLPNPKVGS